MAIKDTSRASTPLPAIFGHFRPMLAQTQKFPWSSKRMFRGQYELVRGSLLRVGGALNACHRGRAEPTAKKPPQDTALRRLNLKELPVANARLQFNPETVTPRALFS